MRTTRIYTTQHLHPDAEVLLEPEPSRHLARALRMRVDDSLVLFNGTGGEYAATITALDKKQVTVHIDEYRECDTESSLAVHLGIALSRGERMDWVVQKATELGARTITPLFTEYAGVKLDGERGEKKLRHWQQIGNSACEQSGRCRPPDIHPAIALPRWLQTTRAERKFVLHPRSHSSNGFGAAPASVALLVGPEGGLSEAEVEAAMAAGFSALQLGPRVLRTETAPLAALAVLQAYWGDMRPAQARSDTAQPD